MAILEVPFVYAQTGYRPRSRALDTCSLSAMVAIKVAELSDADCPIVARCAYPGQRPFVDERGITDWDDAEIEVDYRLVNGRLARRAVPDSAFMSRGYGVPGGDRPEVRRAFDRWITDASCIGTSEAQAAMQVLRLSLTSRNEELVLPLPGRHKRLWEIQPEEASLFVRIQGDDRAARARATASALGGAVNFVNGALYVPSLGPAWRMDEDGEVLVASPEVGWLSDEAIASARLPGDEGVLQDHAGSIAILDPGAFPAPLDEYAARAAAVIACDDTAARTLALARSSRGLRSLADIMALVDEDGFCGPELTEALDGFATAWEAVVSLDDPRRWRSEVARVPGERAAARLAATHETGVPRNP